jgi:hypothetical protein
MGVNIYVGEDCVKKRKRVRGVKTTLLRRWEAVFNIRCAAIILRRRKKLGWHGSGGVWDRAKPHVQILHASNAGEVHCGCSA